MKGDVTKGMPLNPPARVTRTATPTAKPHTQAATAAVQAARPAGSTDSIATQERRQGQRVLLRIRAQIHVVLQGKSTTMDVSTLSVNPSGALVLAGESLRTDTMLVLEHSATKQRIACKVVRSPQKTAEGYQVPLEFDAPAPDFWKIDFPPADWRPED